MKQIVPLGDERVLADCIYCGAEADSRDHVPSRVLLDEPFPENLPVVPSCRACNNSFSLDEEYCAALLDCVAVGSAEPTTRHRSKVQRILARQPALPPRSKRLVRCSRMELRPSRRTSTASGT